jgi:hypothetical protein
MSRDALVIVDPSRVPEPLRRPIHGVPFATIIFVDAARLDALPERAVLDWLAVRERDFARAEAAWNDRLDEELAREASELDGLYEEWLGRALSLWSRRVDPLDRDVAAWVAFQRHRLDADDARAEELGLTAGDELRLARMWRARTTEPLVAERALSAWSEPHLGLPSVALSPFVFPPRSAS